MHTARRKISKRICRKYERLERKMGRKPRRIYRDLKGKEEEKKFSPSISSY